MTWFNYDTILNNKLFYSMSYPTEEDVEIERMKSFSDLGSGWDFGDGEAPSQYVIERAIQTYLCGLNLGYNASVRPETSGGIVIGFFIKDNFVDVTVKENSLFDIRYEKGIGANYNILDDQENITMEEVSLILKSVQQKCFLLEPFTSVNMIPTEDDFPVIAFKSMGMVFPSFPKNALAL